MTSFRDRIVAFKRVKAKDLIPHPENWRVHTDGQRQAMSGILAEVGFVDALMVRATEDGELMIIDGHLRAETAPDAEIPVLIVDLSDEEARKVLATFDPLAALAVGDKEALGKLLHGMHFENDGLTNMLEDLAKEHGIDPNAIADDSPVDLDGEGATIEGVIHACPKCGFQWQS